MKRVNYVQIEPKVEMADLVEMSPKTRGCYVTLCYQMYVKGGGLDFDMTALARLCDMTELEFAQVWGDLDAYFFRRRNRLFHSRVQAALRRAKKSMQDKRRAGLISAAARQQRCNAASTKESEANENEKRSNLESNRESSSSASDSLRFVSALDLVIKPKSEADRSAYRNLAVWVQAQILKNRFDEEIYKRIIDYAAEARGGRKPIAVFFSTLKRELGYRSQVVKTG